MIIQINVYNIPKPTKTILESLISSIKLSINIDLCIWKFNIDRDVFVLMSKGQLITKIEKKKIKSFIERWGYSNYKKFPSVAIFNID